MLPQVLLTNLAAIAAVMFVLWFISVLRRDASLVDLFWGLGFVVIAWVSIWRAQPADMRPLVLAVLVSIWGLRLASYLTWRNWGKPEDFRYAAMRERHGRRFSIVSLYSVFGLQGLLLWIISLPIQAGMIYASGWHLAAILGLALWLAGLAFEAIGDYQLACFKASSGNRGAVMNCGLWRYTRHPNYFGDFLVWWGFYLLASAPGSWWWTMIGPLLMSFLLIRVSGVRLLEKTLKGRVDGYAEYVRTTSAFFPLPPRKNKASG